MTALIRRPLLVGGVGLGAILWLWTNIETSVAGWGDWVTLLAIAGGGLRWHFPVAAGAVQRLPD